MACNRCEKKFCTYKIPIFKHLECDEVDELRKLIEHKEYKKGEILFQEGEVAKSLYILNEGELKLYKYTKDGKEQILHMLSEGDFFGELHLLKETPFKYYAKAITDCNICTLKKEQFRKVVLEKPEVGIKVLEEMGERLTHLETLATMLSDNDGDTKLAYLLVKILEQKYGTQIQGQIRFDLPITREDMASYTGLTRETVSRKLKHFGELGIIKMVGHKKIEVLNYEKLKEML